jgi:hypothetical protein
MHLLRKLLQKIKKEGCKTATFFFHILFWKTQKTSIFEKITFITYILPYIFALSRGFCKIFSKNVKKLNFKKEKKGKIL